MLYLSGSEVRRLIFSCRNEDKARETKRVAVLERRNFSHRASAPGIAATLSPETLPDKTREQHWSIIYSYVWPVNKIGKISFFIFENSTTANNYKNKASLSSKRCWNTFVRFAIQSKKISWRILVEAHPFLPSVRWKNEARSGEPFRGSDGNKDTAGKKKLELTSISDGRRDCESLGNVLARFKW